MKFYVQSHHYHNVQNARGDNPICQLTFDPHITSPPGVNTDQYSDPTTCYATVSSACLHLIDNLHKTTYSVLINSWDILYIYIYIYIYIFFKIIYCNVIEFHIFMFKILFTAQKLSYIYIYILLLSIYSALIILYWNILCRLLIST